MKFENYVGSKDILSAQYEPGVDPELLPCPFCGSTDVAVCNTHTASYWVECACSAARGAQGRDGKTKAAHRAAFLAAIRAWNTRAGRADGKGTT